MKKFLIHTVAIAALTFTLCACGSDDNEGEGGGSVDEPTEPIAPSGEMEQMTPIESKEFLDNTAKEAINKFRAADQKEFITTCSYFSEHYGYYDFPYDFGFDDEDERVEDASAPGKYMKALARAMESADVSRAAASTVTYVCDLDLAKCKGIYEPVGGSWKRTGDSNDVIFRFTDGAGKACELKAQFTGGTIDGQVTGSESYVDWDDEKNELVEYDVEYVYNYRLPKDLNVTLTSGGTSLANIHLVSDINVEGHSMNIDANITVQNIIANARIEGNDNRINQNTSMTVSGETFMTSIATVNGSNLCNPDFYGVMSEDDVVKLLKNGNVTVSLLDKVRVDATVNYTAALNDAMLGGMYFDSWDFDDNQAAAEKAVKATVNALNDNVKAEVRYNNKQTVQATILWKYIFNDYGYGWEYEIEPLLKFDADGTTYSFEEYFETGFAGIEDNLAGLVQTYEKVWESVK